MAEPCDQSALELRRLIGAPSWPEARRAAGELEPVDLASLRVALSEGLGFATVDAGIRRTFRAAVARFAAVFGRADERDPPIDDRANEVLEVDRAPSFVAAHGKTFRQRPELLAPNIRASVEQGLALNLEDVAGAMRRFLAFMADYDALICPAMAVPPFPAPRALRRGDQRQATPGPQSAHLAGPGDPGPTSSHSNIARGFPRSHGPT